MSGRDRAWLEFDLGALVQNMQKIQKFVGAHTVPMAVVKADGYGHGAVQMSKALQNAGTRCFAVACIDEGLKLREAGIEGMILILGPSCPKRAAEVIEARLTPSIHSIEEAEAFSEAAAGCDPYPVHIKIDSGMCRMGVRYDQIEKFCEQARELNLKYDGIFSHFAEATDEEFSNYQIANFNAAEQTAAAMLGAFRWKHMCATVAMLKYPHAHFNMVRPGNILYGMTQDAPEGVAPAVTPVMSLHSRLTVIKCMQPGDTAGYGRTYCAESPHDTGIATIGFADGYPRALSNNAEVLIRGKRYPVAGRVSMDTTIVRLDNGHNCQAGDEVVLIGRQGDDEITAEEIANRVNSITQDITSCMGQRLQRIYQEWAPQ